MPDSVLVLLVEESPLMQVCRNQHVSWSNTVTQCELEIDQLLELLADLPQNPTYRSLRLRAGEYYEALDGLKCRYQRIRSTMICESACTIPAQSACIERRIKPDTTQAIDSHLNQLTESFRRIKAGCYQFLSLLVTLNLL